MESRVCAQHRAAARPVRRVRRVTATFFVLGWVAERFPALVARIAARGHEVASHGYAHRLIYDQTPTAFRDDVRRAKDLLEDRRGRARGSATARRATRSPASLWALDVLIEEGYRYDASIFPIRHDRYGIPTSPRHPHVLTRDGGVAASKCRRRPSAGPDEPAGRRRRLLPHPAVLRGRAGASPGSIGVSGGRRFSTCTRGRSIPAQPRLNAGLRQPVPALPQPRQDRAAAAAAAARFPVLDRAAACSRPFIRKRRALRRRCGWPDAEAAMTPYTESRPHPCRRTSSRP